jgi:calcium/calmodulin-dependent protein kinase I
VARVRLRRGIELVKLANRIEALKMHDDEEDDEDGNLSPVPGDAAEAAAEALNAKRFEKGLGAASIPAILRPGGPGGLPPKKSLSKVARGAIFREVVLAKVREVKEQQAQKKFEEEIVEKTQGHSP